MSKYVRKREHLHEALCRDGWILPSKHAAICTTTWMLQVRNGDIFCLNEKEEFKQKKCYSPPTREILHRKLEDSIIQLEAAGKFDPNVTPRLYKLIGSLRLRAANVDWYVTMLGYFNPDDPIFAKDYKYVRQTEVPIEPVINNSDGLFTSLPPLTE